MEAEKAAGGGGRTAAGTIVLATVKGDVHDIGKNIVGVVLACNGYTVKDLGVMVPCETILETAEKEQMDIIGLSGLITPSLDEMCFVAREMERRGTKKPLLIGGATTSRQHTAVKIAPCYGGPTVHVLDASRAAGVLSSLMDEKARPAFQIENEKEQHRLRELFAHKQGKPLVPLAVARARGPKLTYEKLEKPPFVGVRLLEEEPLDEIAKVIDWTFFFTAWNLVGKFPDVLSHPEQGEAARELFDEGKALLARMIREKRVTARGTYGFFPAHREGDDIVLPDARFCMLRQQQETKEAHRSLADFIAPAGDHIGLFAVTAGIGLDDLVRELEAEKDDYHAIMAKALADRLAEAFAERLHQRVRREWYAPGEELTPGQLVHEEYRGIRPAFGYPACPDHTDKRLLFSLLGAERIGMALTESFAMLPAASVSGIYLAHPEARYFNIGRIGKDQAEDYARRKDMTLAEVERWLGSNLGYEP
jgi:5-methyltetrahydrofolate--homocysteine methyltransferase